MRTGAEQAAEDAKDTDEFISFLRYFLLAFGVVALFVGAFVIFNSLSITIAQRTRELATLRTLGASRRQVRFSVIVESLVMGTLASIVGLFLGLALATGLFKLFDAVGFTLPNSGLIFSTRTIIVSLALGIIVTLLASILPAFKATRVPPIAAVREGATIAPGRFARFRTPIAGVITVLGFAGLLWGLFGPDLETTQILLFMILGMVLVFIGVAMLSAPLIPGLTGILGWPGATFGGAAGALARDNARRNPQRTASTAAALMIGLALVTLVATLAGSVVQTFTGAVNEIFVGDYAITAQNNFSPIPIDAAEAAAKAPGVVAVGNVRTGETLVFGSTEFSTAVDPGAAKVIKLDWVEGSEAVFGELGKDGAFVDKDFAEKHNLQVGSPVEITFANGNTETFLVKGIFDPPSGGSPFGVVTISTEAWDAQNPNPKNIYSFVLMDGGETDANAAALEAALEPFPNAKFATRQEFVDNQISGLKSILNILYVLLGALDHRQPLRDRQHARPQRLRAHARDRDAAGDRDDAATDAPDDPARERDHIADRCVHRHRARRDPRRVADLQDRPDRLLVPDEPGDRVRDRGGHRRGAGGDLPGAPRCEARPARSAALRVGDRARACRRPSK